jgi:hypothetical protein
MLLELPALGRRPIAAARGLHPIGELVGMRSFRGHSFLLEGQSEGSESVVQP